MSHKIKIIFKEKKNKIHKNQKDILDKISLTFDDHNKEKNNIENNYESLLNNVKPNQPIIKTEKLSKSTNILFDRELYKQFKKHNFSKLDLHGQTLDGAKKTISNYCETNSKNKKPLHIIITGLGNKPNQKEFFSGKIRNSFTQWIHEIPISKFIHSYHPCKIQHGGLGAFYIKLRLTK